MKVKFKALHELAFLPHYSKPGDAGLDIYAVDDGVFDRSKDYIEYRTGLACEIPAGCVGLIFPRSSISNYTLSLTNAVGVLDSGFRGEIRFRFKYTGANPQVTYRQGDRIGQLLVVPYPYVEPCWAEKLTESARGDSGYGSSGP